ncbi:hypothetical protein DFH09DRAFT_1084754 [Mycena vulgaris]|nr:hypothetical protein DFH09DRAFT_1084754 [Mycena vulgaris]
MTHSQSITTQKPLDPALQTLPLRTFNSQNGLFDLQVAQSNFDNLTLDSFTLEYKHCDSDVTSFSHHGKRFWVRRPGEGSDQMIQKMGRDSPEQAAITTLPASRTQARSRATRGDAAPAGLRVVVQCMSRILLLRIHAEEA